MAKRGALSDIEIAAILAAEAAAAVGYRNSALADDQETALDYYYGEPFGDEEEGRSQVVTRDVAEVHDWMKPEVLRPFVSGERVVSLQAKKKGKTDVAAQLTEALQYQFMVENHGFRILSDAFTDGALQKLGVVKVWCEDEERIETETLENAPLEQVVMMLADGWAMAEADTADIDMDAPAEGATLTVKLEKTVTRKAKRVDNVPPEEFLFPRRLRTLETADYLGHRCRKTADELADMGFDVAGMSDDEGPLFSDTRLSNRFEDEGGIDGDDYGGVSGTETGKRYVLHEEYVRLDADGSGRAKLWQVMRIGSNILSRVEVERHPFEAWTPFPMPHRLVGMSLADKVMDIQRVRSVLLRQGLDAMYTANAPGTFLHEDSITDNTIEDLLTVRPNRIVRFTGNVPPTPMSTPFAAREAFQMLEFMSNEREGRTGISRYSQGMNADTLNQTATGASIIQEQGQQLKEFIARQFGDFLGRVFAKMRLLNKDHAEPMTVPMRGDYADIPPAAWADDMDISVQVGLGAGRKEQRLMFRTQLLQIQREGLELGLVQAKHLYRTAEGMVSDMGLGEPSDYFLDPESDEAKAMAEQRAQQPPPEDPKVAEGKAKLALEQGKAEADMAMAQQRAAFDAQSAQADMAMRQQDAMLKMELARETAAMQQRLAEQKAAAELQLAERKMEAEFALAERRMEMEERIALASAAANASAKVEAAGLSKNRPGGSLSE